MVDITPWKTIGFKESKSSSIYHERFQNWTADDPVSDIASFLDSKIYQN